MDQGLPEEIMEGEDVVRNWQNKNSQENWAEREWTEEYDEESGMSIKEDMGRKGPVLEPLDPFDVTDADLQPSSSGPGESHPTLGEGYPKVGECLYIQWVEDEGSDSEAPGWYFGTIESINDDGNFVIVYADNATEVLDLTKVSFVLAKSGGKFYYPTRPKPYKARPRPSKTPKTPRPRKSPVKSPRASKKNLSKMYLDTLESAEGADSSRDIIREVLREHYQEKQQSAPEEEKQHARTGDGIPRHAAELPHHTPELPRHASELPHHASEQPHHASELEHHTPEEPVPEEMEQLEQREEPGRAMLIEEEALMEEEDEEMVEQLPEEEEEGPEEEEIPEGSGAGQQRIEAAGTRYLESGNIIIPSNISSRHPQQQIILVQRGPNGELEEVPQTEGEEDEEEPGSPVPVATIIEETTQVAGEEGHIEEEHEYEEDGDESATEIIYPDDLQEEEEGEDRRVRLDLHNTKVRPVATYRPAQAEVVVDRNGHQIMQRGNVQLVQRGNVQLVRRMSTDQYLPPHSSEQVCKEQVERYDGRIISSEQMLMGSRQRYSDDGMTSRRGYEGQSSTHIQTRDVENYQQMSYQDDEHNEDLERLQGRLITEDAMNMLDDKGQEGDDEDYSGDDEQDPRMPRRRGKYVRKTPEELDQVPRPWQCEFCPRAFPNKYHLQIHLRTHTGEKPYRCTECDMAFSHSSNLCSHIRTHNGIKPYKCKHCGKEFGRSNNMKAHTRIHTGEKPFECRFCGKAFRFGNHLTIHERSHTGERPYKCTYCDRAFRNSSNLRTHERLHTDERPYRCRYCDRAFSGSGNLHAHERVHTGERPFQCDVCTKSFSQSSTLRIHQRIHTGDKRYQCSLCGRRFIQSNHLKTHLRRMHHIDDSLPSIRTMHKTQDPYGMQPLNPNNFRVVTKQEPDEMDHYEREMHNKPTMLKSKHERVDMMRPSPLIVDDDVRTKTWGPGSPLLHGDEENHRHN